MISKQTAKVVYSVFTTAFPWVAEQIYIMFRVIIEVLVQVQLSSIYITKFWSENYDFVKIMLFSVYRK